MLISANNNILLSREPKFCELIPAASRSRTRGERIVIQQCIDFYLDVEPLDAFAVNNYIDVVDFKITILSINTKPSHRRYVLLSERYG